MREIQELANPGCSAQSPGVSERARPNGTEALVRPQRNVAAPTDQRTWREEIHRADLAHRRAATGRFQGASSFVYDRMRNTYWVDLDRLEKPPAQPAGAVLSAHLRQPSTPPAYRSPRQDSSGAPAPSRRGALTTADGHTSHPSPVPSRQPNYRPPLPPAIVRRHTHPRRAVNRPHAPDTRRHGCLSGECQDEQGPCEQVRAEGDPASGRASPGGYLNGGVHPGQAQPRSEAGHEFAP